MCVCVCVVCVWCGADLCKTTEEHRGRVVEGDAVKEGEGIVWMRETVRERERERERERHRERVD